MNIIKKYPNVIVFHHDDLDGILGAYIIKSKYDNNLIHPDWERNVQCINCKYGEKYDLNYFKETVEQYLVNDQENIVYMIDYAIQPYDYMLNFWNWLTDKGCKFFWIDHHITAIESLKHLNIPGFQSSAKSGCMNTWYEVMKNEQGIPTPPNIIKIINDLDLWNKNSEFSWEKQIMPFLYFMESIGNELNDNTGELVSTIKNCINEKDYITKCINIGKYIYKFVKRKYESNSKKTYETTWNDYKCLLINSTYKGSTQFECIENYQDYDLLITWCFNGKKYVYGIYSANPKINVGELCKMYLNGGGHKGAGGGESKDLIFKIE